MSRQILYCHYINSSSLIWLGLLTLHLTNSSINPLIPGYHPTNIDSRISIICFLRAAADLKDQTIAPNDFGGDPNFLRKSDGNRPCTGCVAPDQISLLKSPILDVGIINHPCGSSVIDKLLCISHYDVYETQIASFIESIQISHQTLILLAFSPKV